jgi:hypothetical protein
MYNTNKKETVMGIEVSKVFADRTKSVTYSFL